MTTPTRRAAPATETARSTPGTRPYQVLAGLAALGILLQGVWAGLFIRPGEPNNGTWVFVHARCAEVTIAAAVAAAAVAFWRLRARRDLLAGSGVLVVLLVVEAYVGGEVFRRPGLAVLHIPLALVLMGLAVWLPFRARR
jgi:heme A synthase